jgi:hypothetical protein
MIEASKTVYTQEEVVNIPEKSPKINGRPPVHGMFGTPEYSCWAAMKQRCFNPKSSVWHRYGGRGIKVCERWIVFENFLSDMGPKPSLDHSIDRIDNDGDYEPRNCKWSTQKEQCDNRANSILVEFNGETKTMRQWSDKTGLGYRLIAKRIKSGWSPERALTTPLPLPQSNQSNS